MLGWYKRRKINADQKKLADVLAERATEFYWKFFTEIGETRDILDKKIEDVRRTQIAWMKNNQVDQNPLQIGLNNVHAEFKQLEARINNVLAELQKEIDRFKAKEREESK